MPFIKALLPHRQELGDILLEQLEGRLFVLLFSDFLDLPRPEGRDRRLGSSEACCSPQVLAGLFWDFMGSFMGDAGLFCAL